MTRDDVVNEARAWMGTPYVHQGHQKGLGCDCAGLVGGVAVALGIVPPDWWETAAAPYAGYSREPSNKMLETICDGFMTRVETMQAANVVGIRWSIETQHLGILAPYPHGGFSMIHALEPRGKVIEHRVNDVWLKRITHIWQMPGVN